MSEQIEDIIKVSEKGQIVIPREVRRKIGVKAGEKLLVLTKNGDILLRKTKQASIEDFANRIEEAKKGESIDVDTVIAEAVAWVRKPK